MITSLVATLRRHDGIPGKSGLPCMFCLDGSLNSEVGLFWYSFWLSIGLFLRNSFFAYSLPLFLVSIFGGAVDRELDHWLLFELI